MDKSGCLLLEIQVLSYNANIFSFHILIPLIYLLGLSSLSVAWSLMVKYSCIDSEMLEDWR